MIGSVALSAQDPRFTTRPDDFFARAKQLIRALYPNLDPSLDVVIYAHSFGVSDPRNPDIMNAFTMDLREPLSHFLVVVPLNSPPPPPRNLDPVLSADFAFNRLTDGKELLNLAVGGPAVTGRRDEFAKEADKHPEWSEAEVAAAMNKAGAKYGPDRKTQFLRELPLQQLKPYIGADLEVVSAEFDVWPLYRHQAMPGWSVKAKWHGTSGQMGDCILLFESFDGKLLSLDRSLP
jgi:hypothetical protein